jgi:predicted DsbA family dithiol-disulfide isomerase
VALGATGVPFFVIDEAYGVAGAQGADVLLGALERAWSDTHPVTMLTGSDPVAQGGECVDGSCSV